MYSFIGATPNPLPIPGGLQLESKRFTGTEKPYGGARPQTPTKLKCKYNVTDSEGRLKTETTIIDPLPEHCTVRDLQSLMHEHLTLSPRHPIDLRYWGQPLEEKGTGKDGEELLDRPLTYYAIKDHSEITVVVKPIMQIAKARTLARPDGVVARLRVVSHKLGAPIPLEGLTPELKLGDLKLRIKEYLARAPIFLVKGPTPPVPNPPPVPLTLAEPLPDGTTTVDAKVGDHFVTDAGGAAAKGKGGGNLKRISDGKVGTLVETDLWKFQIEPEQKPTLQYGGFVLDDESLVTSYLFLNNEILWLNFQAPWEPDEPNLPPPKEKGGKSASAGLRRAAFCVSSSCGSPMHTHINPCAKRLCGLHGPCVLQNRRKEVILMRAWAYFSLRRQVVRFVDRLIPVADWRRRGARGCAFGASALR